MNALSDRRIPVRAFLLVVAATCALLLALPGQTVTTRYLNDLLLILDGAYRITAGHVPSHDFHTPLGPLAYYLPAAGYGLSGSLGGAMPAAMALATLALSVPMLHVLGTRLHPVIALLFGVFLLLVLAVPINLGEGITALTFAKFYNRIGWAALGILLVMFLPPREVRGRQDLPDALCAAALTLVMLYTKLTYGIVAMAFLVFMLTDRQQRRWVLHALGLIVVSCTTIEIVWQSSLSYLNDLRLALDVGGRLRGTWGQIADHILVNLTDYVLLGLFAGLSLRRTCSAREGFFYLFCAVTGFLIVNQNFQAWGIVALHAAAAVAAETILRHEEGTVSVSRIQAWSVAAGARLLFLALVLPTIVHCSAALGLHMIAASTRAGQSLDLPHLERVRLANLWTWGDYDAANQYLATVRDGVKALSEANLDGGKILALDRSNPFPMILGAAPPEGDLPWLQWERTLNASAFIPAEALLANADIVMEPRTPIGDDTGNPELAGLKALYGPYIADHYENVRETDHWKIHRRLGVQPRIGMNASDSS
ncbi:hypothetical protein [Microvirga makkahensis]|uniref:Glycosyltransferase RgtA/B/C/D-like domain-containing protein n=1 Tax=Microvirga makkahensis TaxID=1128670 RepID=A0A7X3MQP0_9HYPH|nr:hypothetical protein [Microvirga makkahensis]MXQ11453.1 hypothetical protein [Microvirga makkahensis]